MRPLLNARRLFAIALLLLASGRSSAQITWNLDYSSDPNGFYIQQRQDVLTNVTNYLSQQFDGRGTVSLRMTSNAVAGSLLATGGASFAVTAGFTNGFVYQRAVSSTGGGTTQGTVTSNISQNWYNFSTGTPTAGTNDFHSVMLHEITHAMGFTSYMGTNGAGAGGGIVYSRLESFFRLGTAANSPLLINANGTANSALFPAAYSSNNVFFHGDLAKEANGGNAVKIYAPTSPDGSELAHNDGQANPNSVMTPSLTTGSSKRTYSNVDIAMLIDIGWNQYSWKGGNGNWNDNATTLLGPRWSNVYDPTMDVFSPVGTITPNVVLTFTGAAFTSTNNLPLISATLPDRFQLMRLVLSASSGTSTIAAAGPQVLRFGSNLGIVPMVRQDGSGDVNISHPIELTNPINGTSPSLKLSGDGAGIVTISGGLANAASNVGSIRKEGASTYVLAGTNTYTGATTVTAGSLRVNGTLAGTGAVSVTGGALGGTGTVSGAVTVASGARLAPGDTGSTPGVLTVNNAVTFQAGSTFSILLNGNTPGNTANNYTRLTTTGPVTINTSASLPLATALNYFPNFTTDRYFIIDNQSASPTTGNFLNLPQGSTFILGFSQAWIYYTGNVTTNSLTGGNDVVISFVQAPVPEPAGLLALAGLVVVFRRFRKSAA